MASEKQLEKPRKNEQRIGESSLIRIIQSGTFYTKEIRPDGRDFFYFHEYGDFLKGQLLAKRSNVNIGRTASYLIKVEEMRQDGEDIEIDPDGDRTEEFFGNKILQRLIDKNELIGSIVRILYIGRQKNNFGHSAKIYDVFKVSGIEKEMESRQDGSTRKYKKNRAGSRAANRAAGHRT